MRKASIVSILVYLTYIAYGIYWIFMFIKNSNNPPEEHPITRMEHILGIALILIGLIAIGIKGIHLATGLGLFSLICGLADAFGVCAIWWVLVLDCYPLGQWLAELDMSTLQQSLPFIILSLFPAVACISNLISTRRG